MGHLGMHLHPFFGWHSRTTLQASVLICLTLLARRALGAASPFLVMHTEDLAPPVFASLTATPNVLWPPNHKLIPIQVHGVVTDNLDPAPQVVARGITMNEGDAVNTYDPVFDDTPGDGNTVHDIQIDQEGTVLLRAERSGLYTGRVCTLVYEATDFVGNTAMQEVIATVPYDVPWSAGASRPTGQLDRKDTRANARRAGPVVGSRIYMGHGRRGSAMGRAHDEDKA